MSEIEKLLPGIEIENITLPVGAIDKNEMQKLEAEYKKLSESYWETVYKQREASWNNTKKKLAKQHEEAQARKKIDDEIHAEYIATIVRHNKGDYTEEEKENIRRINESLRGSKNASV
ncbi:hypothetical protein [Methanosarcina mazei]|uniref:Uncharacterized protein n=1 Tax=Methanosarcina mazei S-6 TaxID=213585 RepID=A0A0E3RIL2_METMZ|nr:hypothetical protein [Methanosarcina mazei]AKB64923.1 hypothetical protein MSMAS_1727 [Methanosarcina mazei S-6]